MYSSNPNGYPNFSPAPPPFKLEPYGEDESTKIGVPVNSKDQSYSDQSQEPTPVENRPRVDWSTGLCDCLSDWRNCCITCWCPCVTFGKIAEIVDKGSSSCGQSGALYALIFCVAGCPCFYSCFYRSKMRRQHRLHKSPCGDCLVHCCCEPCALCQEYRELNNRGFAMEIGWHGNEERKTREMEMEPIPPVVEEGMSR
ncbi:unnamed protein product [Ilex paraguariensis]|uniref:Uncharacterized protein n=1 Tax=Ilex paraguariensis TaxID=185542 RepID=A0ABC8TTI9_9AQUA